MKTVPPRRKSPSSPGEGQFDDYEERFVSLERHHRTVHYYCRKDGKETLAVVGTEKSPRHLNYVVQAAFLEAVGLSSTGELLKWRTRREVLEWLHTFVKEPKSAHGQTSGPEDRAAGKFRKQKKLLGKPPRRPAKSWLGDDCQTHFSSVQHEGFTVAAEDFVRVSGGRPSTGSERVAYVEDLAQAEGEEVILQVRWLEPADSLQEKRLRLTESTGRVPLSEVAGPAAVLTQAHWDQFTASLSEGELQHVFFCSGGIPGLNVQGLKGYWTQRHAIQLLGEGVLSSLRPPRKRPLEPPPSSPPQLSSASRGGSDLSWGDIPKKKRFTGSYAEDDVESTPPLRKKRRRAPGEPPRRLGRPPKLLSGGPVSPKPIHGGTKRVQGTPTARGLGEFGGFAVGDAVETLCEDSGLRGCWFRGKVIAVAALRRLKIWYEELDDEETGSKLEEWVTVSRSSTKDSLDRRAFGRSKVRPRPPKQDLASSFSLGGAVDAWWNDGWWEGVVAAEKDGKVGVYFPGEGDSAWFEPGDLRVSKEWVEGAWKEVPALVVVTGLMKEESGEAMEIEERVSAENDSVVKCKAEDALPPSAQKAVRFESEMGDIGAGDHHTPTREQHLPTTPVASEPQKGSAVLALCSFPVAPRSPSVGFTVRKIGPSKLGQNAPLPSKGGMIQAANAPPEATSGAPRKAEGSERFECLEKMDDEDDPKWGVPNGRADVPRARSGSSEGGVERTKRTPRPDTVPTPAGKERAFWTHTDASPSPSPSFQGVALPQQALKWEEHSNALETEHKVPREGLVKEEQRADEVPASKLAEMDPNSGVNKAACEVPRPVITVKRAEASSRPAAAQQSCSVDAGPAKSDGPQPILSR